MKNNTFAIDAAPSAIPPNPKIAAMIAITKKITDQRNIVFFGFNYTFRENHSFSTADHSKAMS
jgi:hypothetical protein